MKLVSQLIVCYEGVKFKNNKQYTLFRWLGKDTHGSIAKLLVLVVAIILLCYTYVLPYYLILNIRYVRYDHISTLLYTSKCIEIYDSVYSQSESFYRGRNLTSQCYQYTDTFH